MNNNPEDFVSIAGDREAPKPTLRYLNNGVHQRRFWKHHDRDDYRCPGCNSDADKYHVHHVDGNVGNGSLENLVALCPECHREDHQQRRFDQHPVDGWKNAFRTEVFEDCL